MFPEPKKPGTGPGWMYSVYLPRCNHSVFWLSTAPDPEGTCLKVGEVLMNRCPLALRNKDVDEVKAALPDWVKPWVAACLKSRSFVPPPEESPRA